MTRRRLCRCPRGTRVGASSHARRGACSRGRGRRSVRLRRVPCGVASVARHRLGSHVPGGTRTSVHPTGPDRGDRAFGTIVHRLWRGSHSCASAVWSDRAREREAIASTAPFDEAPRRTATRGGGLDPRGATMSWTTDHIPDQTGRVAVVTGGNGGLGLETVRELARKGAHVVIGARDLEKAATAEAEVRRELPDASLEIHALDLGSLASVRAFANEVLAAHDAIDLLFCNAGVMATPEGTTEDGFETQFGINHLGHVELTRLLLPALHRAGAGRVVTTTSTARFAAGPYDLDDPHHRRRRYEPWEAYGYSKLANLQFALELDRRLRAAGSQVRALSADPGFSNTDLQQRTARTLPGFSQRLAATLVRWIGQSAAAGALEQLRAATDPSAEGGTLYRPRWIAAGAPVVARIEPRLRAEADLAKLWDVSEREIGATFDVAALVGPPA